MPLRAGRRPHGAVAHGRQVDLELLPAQLAPEWPARGAPFEVTFSEKYESSKADWYGSDREEILRRTVGAGLTFRD